MNNHLERSIKEPSVPEIIKEADLYQIASRQAAYCISLAEQICGSEHPLTLDIRDDFKDVRPYLSLTSTLLKETMEEWKDYFPVDSKTHEQMLRSMVEFDFGKIYPLSTIKTITSMMRCGTYNPRGAVSISYQFEHNPQQKGCIQFNQQFATSNGFADTEQVYTAYKDRQNPSLPFIYLFSAPPGELQGYVHQVYSTIANLMRDEPPIADWPPTIPYPQLSTCAKSELANCECIVLQPNEDRFITQRVPHAQDKATFLIPISQLPWFTPQGPTEYFLQDVIPTLEHETRHLADFRRHDGALISTTLFEIRAMLTEITFFQKFGQTDVAKQVELQHLMPYMKILHGDPGTPHMETFLQTRIQEDLCYVSETQLDAVLPYVSNELYLIM